MYFSKDEIIQRLNDRINRKEIILLGGAGAGLIGKLEQMADVDMVMITAADNYRMEGRPSVHSYLTSGIANEIMLRVAPQVIGRVDKIPLIAGVACGDPYRNHDNFLDELKYMGFSGIINAPASYGHGAEMEIETSGTHLSFEADRKMMERASAKGMFTAAYVFTEKQAIEMAGSGVDMIIPHVGLTVGGTLGIDEADAMSITDAITYTRAIGVAARKTKENVFILCHGGMFNSPENVQKCINDGIAQGFVGTSAFDQIPIMREMLSTMNAYTSIHI